VTRYGSVIRLKPDRVDEYIRLHADVWPAVRDTIRACHIRNYSIFYKDGWLFSYYEYIGDDYAADMARMAADPATREWWALCMPCQEPLDSRAPGEWWAGMREVFHQD
jgi:L-rhamnose mutarotase